jgi:hypothetical protein
MTVARMAAFYYTNQYLQESGINWHTWIVPFRFPSCGHSKGSLQGSVRSAGSGQALAGVTIRAASLDQTVTVLSGVDGQFLLELAEGEYTVTAGPQPPGYPVADSLSGVVINAGETNTVSLALEPYPSLSLVGVY